MDIYKSMVLWIRIAPGNRVPALHLNQLQGKNSSAACNCGWSLWAASLWIHGPVSAFFPGPSLCLPFDCHAFLHLCHHWDAGELIYWDLVGDSSCPDCHWLTSLSIQDGGHFEPLVAQGMLPRSSCSVTLGILHMHGPPLRLPRDLQWSGTWVSSEIIRSCCQLTSSGTSVDTTAGLKQRWPYCSQPEKFPVRPRRGWGPWWSISQHLLYLNQT